MYFLLKSILKYRTHVSFKPRKDTDYIQYIKKLVIQTKLNVDYK